MANEEHLAILEQGTDVWNAWRDANPDVKPDLRGGNLSSANLSSANLSNANLSNANLLGANLQEANLQEANLQEATLLGVNLQRAKMVGARLYNIKPVDSNLNEADLSEADLSKADLRDISLSNANLSNARLQETNLSNARLQEANLSNARLQEANLSNARLQGANLQGAWLLEANLSRADLRRADLSGADLRRADLRQAILQLAKLQWAQVGATRFENVDLSEVLGLESLWHYGPSTIDTNTLYRSKGKIPEAFLRGCGVPDSLIEYLPSLIGAMEPLQYYSCFISYSSKDEAFAKRLHERMRAEHLRVWFAPEDMKGGVKIYDQIEQAIQVYDRLLLVLSPQSIASDWVTTEIYNARQSEMREKRRKLFPIRLMDMDILKAWKCPDDTGQDLARELRQYHIPDFSNWKDHDAFEKAFARLLKDLRAAEQRP